VLARKWLALIAVILTIMAKKIITGKLFALTPYSRLAINASILSESVEK